MVTAAKLLELEEYTTMVTGVFPSDLGLVT